VYQVAWVRLFTLTLGHTVAASSTVLAAFMGGLAFGAWIAGRLSAEPARNLKIYAALELLIATAAVALPVILSAFEPLIASAYADGTNPVGFAFVRVAVSLGLLGMPAAAMGATYPVAVAWLASVERGQSQETRVRPALDAGALYVTNTAGAAAGAIAAGFWLIPLLGIRGTTWVGVSLNIAAGGGALWLARAGPIAQKTGTAPRARRSSVAVRNLSASRPVLAITTAGISGFAALVFEVAWTRLLALVIGPTTYAFALMAASFISGIAVGSSLGMRVARRTSDLAGWLAAMLAMTGLTTLVAAWFAASRLPLIIAHQTAANSEFGPLLFREAFMVMMVLIPASISFGATFTLALATVSSGVDAAAKEAARVYAVNTLGAVAGALAAGFLFVPRFGLQDTFVYGGRSLVVVGAAIAMAAKMDRTRRWRPDRRALAAAGVGLAAIVASLALPAWDRDLITSGAYKYARLIPAEDLEWSLHTGSLEFYKEGAAGTVSVRRVAGSRSLAIDGKVDASNGGDMLTQRLLGILPTLLHSAPREALVIGLGSGVTADAVLASGEVRRLDIVEISPEVVDASAYFDRENREVLKKPGVRLLIGDGRSHLRLSDRQYDVIVSEPSNPWMAGVAALFTREFFETARSRLRSGGVFCQWAHTYEIAEHDLRSIVHTFASVFPDGTMWLVGEADLLLIGSVSGNTESRILSVAERSRQGSVPVLLADVGVVPSAAPFVLLSLFAGGPQELAAFGMGAVQQTDDRMLLEFTAAQAMYAPPEGSAMQGLVAGAGVPAAVAETMKNAGAAEWTARGHAALKAKAFGMARESFRRALALDSRSPSALRGSTDAAVAADRLGEETEFLKALAAAEPDNAAVRVELSHVLATLGHIEEAVAAAIEAARIDPGGAEPLEQLASIFADIGDAMRLTAIADELVTRFPARDEGQYYRAAALFLSGRAVDAERSIRRLLGSNPRHAKAQNLLGAVCASLANHDCALAAFGAALDLDPRDPSVYVNLGYLRVARGDSAGAARFFSEALSIDATSEAARRGLADLAASR
jgi:spermidine synthase